MVTPTSKELCLYNKHNVCFSLFNSIFAETRIHYDQETHQYHLPFDESSFDGSETAIPLLHMN